MKKGFIICLMLFATTSCYALLQNPGDTSKGYFIFYSSQNLDQDVIEVCHFIYPLHLNTQRSAIDSFNYLLSSNVNLLQFLSNSQKVHVSFDFGDVNYLKKKYNLDSLSADKLFSLENFLINKKNRYIFIEHNINYRGTYSSIVLFEAEIVTLEMDIPFMRPNCFQFDIKDNVICYAYVNQDNKFCTGPALISLKIIDR